MLTIIIKIFISKILFKSLKNYRHVDNILFENPQIVERFLNYWRKSGHQRMGFLYGRYEVHDGVPLGIRVSIAAIYEPPQVLIEPL